MPVFTRTGPTARGDFPPRRNSLWERIWRGSWVLWLFSAWRTPFGMLIFLRGRRMEEDAEPKEVEQPWHGLPEADLTEEERRAALERMHRD